MGYIIKELPIKSTISTIKSPHLPPRAKEVGRMGENPCAKEAADRIVKQVLMTLIMYPLILQDSKVMRLLETWNGVQNRISSL